VEGDDSVSPSGSTPARPARILHEHEVIVAVEAEFEKSDAHRSLMCDQRVYSSSPIWRIEVSPHGVAIVPRSLWKLGLGHLLVFALLGVGLYSMTWFGVSPDFAQIGVFAAWFCWFMGVAVVVGTALFEKYRTRKGWLVCDLTRCTVSCPRLDKWFKAEQVRALQMITGKAALPDPGGRAVATLTQLNLIAEEDGQLVRYPLIGDYGPGRLARQAEVLSRCSGIPLVKEKAPGVADWADEK
jgi:hypothetical protein